MACYIVSCWTLLYNGQIIGLGKPGLFVTSARCQKQGHQGDPAILRTVERDAAFLTQHHSGRLGAAAAWHALCWAPGKWKWMRYGLCRWEITTSVQCDMLSTTCLYSFLYSLNRPGLGALLRSLVLILQAGMVLGERYDLISMVFSEGQGQRE